MKNINLSGNYYKIKYYKMFETSSVVYESTTNLKLLLLYKVKQGKKTTEKKKNNFRKGKKKKVGGIELGGRILLLFHLADKQR